MLRTRDRNPLLLNLRFPMATEILGFTTKETRDEQYRQWTEDGSQGVVKYTTHEGNNPAIIWVVARTEPIATVVRKVDKKIDKKGQPDGQNSVYDNSGQPTDISEDRELAQRMPDGRDTDGFRDWSA